MYYNPPTGKISKLIDIGFEGCPCQDEDGDRIRPRHKPTCVYVGSVAVSAAQS